MQTSLFIFRQDLRVEDNIGLLNAIKESDSLLPVFIFDTTILEQFPKDSRVVWFLIDAIKALDESLQELGSALHIYHGTPAKLIPKIAAAYNITTIYRNESYGKGAIARDAEILSRAREQGITCKLTHDYLLCKIDSVPARKVFTPFYKLRQKVLLANYPILHTLPEKIPSLPIITNTTIAPGTLDHKQLKNQISHQPNIHRPIDNRHRRVKNFEMDSYEAQRNTPSIDGTSQLSPYIRFGLVSIRQVFLRAHADKENPLFPAFISELAWREFRHHIAYNFPASRTTEFQEKRRGIQRDNNLDHFMSWKNGMTGYPMVDAGMRQLLAENWMHGRTRMVVASFLTKDLLIDRRWWEKHFADYLIDYDSNVNNWNRQWSASVGADPKPLRIFSPMLQSQRFDPECLYIKKRLPELANIPPKHIHDPLTHDLSTHEGVETWYPRPIIDHYTESKKAKQAYYEAGN